MLRDLLPTPRKRNAEDDLIPLINIVFLLLTFFMIAGQIRAMFGDDVELPHTQSHQSEQQLGNVLSIEASGTILWDQQVISLQEFALLLKQSAISSGTLRVRADKNLTAIELEPIFTLLRQHPPKKVLLYSKSEAAQ